MENSFRVSPLPFRMLLDEAAKLLRQNFRRLFFLFALPVAVINGVLAAFQVPFLSRLTQLEEGNFDGFSVGLTLTLICVGVLLLLFMMVLYTAAGALSVDIAAGRPIDGLTRLRFVMKPSRLGTLFLVGVTIFAGMICCFFPGVYAALILSFVVPVMVEEGRTGSGVLSRSSQLVRSNPQGNFLDAPIVKIFVLWLVGTMLSFSLAMLTQLPLGLLQQYLILRDSVGAVEAAGSAWNPLWLQVPASIVGSLASTLAYIYMWIGTALLYFDTLQRKEGTDLEVALDELTGSSAAASEEIGS